jgi:hypothetical protein
MVEKPGAAQPIDNAPCRIGTFGLGVVHDPRSIETSMQAGIEPTRCIAREARRLGQVIDESLLAAFWHREDVDLRDDTGIGTNERHAASFPLRKRSQPTA